MSFRCAITGIGLATPLAVGVIETWNALVDGRYITTHSRVPIKSDQYCADVDSLALLAAREALAGHDPGLPTSLIVGTSKGAIVDWITPPPHMQKHTYVAGGQSRAFGLASTAALLARELRLGCGARLTLSAACASGLAALARAVMMIRSHEASRVMVVASEASLHPLFLGCFNRLGVLPSEAIGCRPFDQHREGFLVSEAAAAVVLEPSENPSTPPWVQIDRISLGADATHLTRSDPDAVTLRRMVRTVTASQPVDLIHAHATGTLANDPIELAVYETECARSDHLPILYSHKGALGHSLGAAGLVSIVINCLAHRHGIIPGNVRTTDPLPTTRLQISSKPVQRRVRRSIATAAGFGGAIAAISLNSP